MTGKEAKERLERQYKRQNEYIKNNFDRVSVTLPVSPFSLSGYCPLFPLDNYSISN